MKRTIRLLALILTLTLALSAAAMATKIDYGTGKTNATKSVSAVSLVKDGCELKFDGDKLNVTYTNSALKEGDMVIVFLLETADKKEITDDKVELSITPTSSNIKYIDQKYIDQKYIDQGTAAATATAGNGSVSFSVYPQNYTNAVVRIISANVNAYVAAVKLDFMYGDVDGNKFIDMRDALAILQYYADKEVQLAVPQAADVDGIAGVDVRDALRVMQHYADKSVILGK